MTQSATASPQSAPSVDRYQGQFGEFTITDRDRLEVKIYRSGLALSALSFAISADLLVTSALEPNQLWIFTWLHASFTIGLGISLIFIHIYMSLLHRVLQAFWCIGTLSAIALAITRPEPFALTVYQHPLSILGIGFTFAALTGIFFKEAFCFHRLETMLLTPIVPLVLLGHLTGLLTVTLAQGLLTVWAGLYIVFAIRKLIQPIPPDIGDKSVFAYLKQRSSHAPEA